MPCVPLPLRPTRNGRHQRSHRGFGALHHLQRLLEEPGIRHSSQLRKRVHADLVLLLRLEVVHRFNSFSSIERRKRQQRQPLLHGGGLHRMRQSIF